jgi:mannose-6-phosphate isomerase-like protein (cupin superfamily)
MDRLTTGAALAELAREPNRHLLELFAHGSLLVEIYKPEKVDHQTTHLRDEIYVIISGAGTFYKNGDQQPFEAGEVLFVAAGEDHRFENFSEDFSTWVFFYGPTGGEVSDPELS